MVLCTTQTAATDGLKVEQLLIMRSGSSVCVPLCKKNSGSDAHRQLGPVVHSPIAAAGAGDGGGLATSLLVRSTYLPSLHDFNVCSGG